jgi:hypothetical protein
MASLTAASPGGLAKSVGGNPGLAERVSATSAYGHFREICVRRFPRNLRPSPVAPARSAGQGRVDWTQRSADTCVRTAHTAARSLLYTKSPVTHGLSMSNGDDPTVRRRQDREAMHQRDEEVWRRRRAGESFRDIGRALGMPSSSVQCCFAWAHGLRVDPCPLLADMMRDISFFCRIGCR